MPAGNGMSVLGALVALQPVVAAVAFAAVAAAAAVVVSAAAAILCKVEGASWPALGTGRVSEKEQGCPRDACREDA